MDIDIVNKDDIKSSYIQNNIKYILDNIYFSNMEYRKELYNIIAEMNEIYTEPVIDDNKIVVYFSGHYIDFLKKYEKGKNNHIHDLDRHIMSIIVNNAFEIFIKEHDEEIINHLMNNFYEEYPPNARNAMVYFFQFALYENMYSFESIGNILTIYL